MFRLRLSRYWSFRATLDKPEGETLLPASRLEEDMKRIIVLAAIACLFTTARAEVSFKPFAYGIMPVPMRSGEEYKIRLARAGAAVVHGWYLARVEYDIAVPELKTVNGEAGGKWKGNIISITAGRQLSAIGMLYPSPKVYRLTRNPAGQAGFLMVITGLSGEWQRGSARLRLTHFGPNSTMATARFGWLGLLWQKDVGAGAILKREGRRFLNPFAGVVRYESGDIVAFCQNYVAPVKSLRLYLHTDFGDIKEELMLGFAYEYHGNSFVKLMFDSARTGGLALELTFSAL